MFFLIKILQVTIEIDAMAIIRNIVEKITSSS